MIGGVVHGAVEPEDALDGAWLQQQLNGDDEARQPDPRAAVRTHEFDEHDMGEEQRPRHERGHDERGGDDVALLTEHARLDGHEKDRRVGALPVEPGLPHLLKGRDDGHANVARLLQRQVGPHAIVPVVCVGVVVGADEQKRHEDGDEHGRPHRTHRHARAPLGYRPVRRHAPLPRFALAQVYDTRRTYLARPTQRPRTPLSRRPTASGKISGPGSAPKACGRGVDSNARASHEGF